MERTGPAGVETFNTKRQRKGGERGNQRVAADCVSSESITLRFEWEAGDGKEKENMHGDSKRLLVGKKKEGGEVQTRSFYWRGVREGSRIRLLSMGGGGGEGEPGGQFPEY